MHNLIMKTSQNQFPNFKILDLFFNETSILLLVIWF